MAPSGSLTLENLTLEGGSAVGQQGGDSDNAGGGGGGAAGLGGAILNQGQLIILNSTLTGDTVQGGGGGLSFTYLQGGGGGGGAGVQHGGGTANSPIGGPGGSPFGGAGATSLSSRGGGAGQDGGGGGGGYGPPVLNAGGHGGGSGLFGGGGGGGFGTTGGGGGSGGLFGGGGGGGSSSPGHPGGYAGANGYLGGAGGTGGASGPSSTPGGGGGGGAGLGGAIFNAAGADINVINSTFYADKAYGGAGGGGGAGAGTGAGGAIFNESGTVIITNSTFANNTANRGGGIFDYAPTSGVFPYVTLNNAIVANSTGNATDYDTNLSSGQESSGSSNLIGKNHGFQGGVVSTANPLLSTLDNYGGPTPTLSLLPGSPAIDAGNNSFLSTIAQAEGVPTADATDQRGLSRLVDGKNTGTAVIDIGADEMQHYVVNTAVDESIPGGGLTSLREAIDLANTGGGLITFASSLAGQTIELTMIGDTAFGPSAFAISSPVTIQGLTGNQGITIARDTNPADYPNQQVPDFRLFAVTATGSLTLDDLTLSDGLAQGGNGGSGAGGGGGAAGLGGAIFNAGTLTLLASTLSGNQAIGGNGGNVNNTSGGGGGGGIGGNGGSSAIVPVFGPAGVGNAYEGGSGGPPNPGSPGIAFRYANYGLLRIAFGGNGGFGGGGGGGGYLGLRGFGDFTGTGGFGGGGGGGSFYAGSGASGGFGGGGGGAGGQASQAFRGSGGFAAGAGGSGYGGGGGGAGLGGAVFNLDGTVTLTNSTLANDTALGGQGGLGGQNGVAGNGLGGAVFNLNGNVTVLNSTLSGNTAQGGGAVYNLGDTGTAAVTINNSILANTANGATDFQANSLYGGPVTSSGSNNIIGSQINFTGSFSSANPQLGPLQNNGGPTQTLAPLPGSPAIDAGNDSVLSTIAQAEGVSTANATDQTGNPRIFGAHIDLGAVEAHSVAATLQFVQLPAAITVGQAFTVQIEVLDQFGNLLSSDNSDEVTLSGAPFVSGTTTVTVQNGIATFSNLVIAMAGTYTLSASSGTLTPATSSSLTITKLVPTVSVTDAGGIYNSSAFPASVTINGASSLEGISPTLSYYAGSNTSGSTLNGTPTAAGTYTVVATFGGSADYASTSSPPVVFTISKATPVVSVTDAGGAFIGSAFPANATVNGAGSLEGISPTLSYYAGSNPSGTPLNGPPTTAGTYTVVAAFAGSADYISASSTPVVFTISKATPVLSVTDLGGAYTGSAYPASVKVNGASSLEGVSPTLAYYAGSNPSGTPLNGAPSANGTYVAVATFPGSIDYTSASSSVTFTIGKIATTLSISSSASSVVAGQNVTFTAILKAASSGASPTGSVCFYDGCTLLGSASLQTSNGLTSASLTSKALTKAGAHRITASYNGNGNFLGSTSATWTQQVTAAAPASITILAGNNQSSSLTTTFGMALQVQVTDAYGNVLSGVAVTFTVEVGSSGASGNFGGMGTATATTSATGVAVAPPLVAGDKLGSFSVVASVAGLTQEDTFSLTVTGRGSPVF